MPRRFIRHPTRIPICLSKPETETICELNFTEDLSAGGVSCLSDKHYQPGEALEVEIKSVKPSFRTIGHVVWCREDHKQYLVGIGFSDLATAYAIRMVEQVCHIEQYRQKIVEQGRELSTQEAALEWIEAHASDFGHHIQD